MRRKIPEALEADLSDVDLANRIASGHGSRGRSDGVIYRDRPRFRRMDSELIAKFPFLEEARQFVDESGADISDLITSPSYEPARARGVQRITDALERSEVSYVPMVRASEYDRLMEVLSYPYARMIVSAVGDRFLTKRYALAEAVRMNRILAGEGRENAMEVSEQLNAPSTADADGIMRIRFTDYLRLANRMKSVDWKLINSDVHSGLVYLTQEKFSRLMQNALQDRIESELPLMTPDEFKPYIRGDVTKVELALAETKARFSPTGGEGMKIEFCPPCINRLLEMSRQGVNLPHSARFALVTFLSALGLSYDQIISIFSESPDFDESIAGYQIRHITGELNGGEAYTPPECATMKTNGICYNPDKICEMEWMTHPLKYYRFKSKPRGDGGAPAQGTRAGNQKKERSRSLVLPLGRIHLPQVPPGDDRPLDGREVAHDGEPEHHYPEPCELEAEYVERGVLAVCDAEHDILDQREQRGEHHAVRPPQEARVQPRSADRLRLGAHVRREEHAHEGQHAEVRVAPPGAEGHAPDHEDVGVPVEHVVEVVPLGAGLAGELGDLAVQGVEVPRDDDHDGADDEEPLVALLAAEPEYHAAHQCEDQADPRDGVRVDVYESARHRREREVHGRSLAV